MKLPKPVHALLREARHAPDRLIHAARRRAWKKKLARAGFPRSIVFVCHGNICRSPYAAAVFERSVPEVIRSEMQIDSGGFVGPGRPSPPESISVAAARGVDLTSHQSRLITHEMIGQADLVVVMDNHQRHLVRRAFHYDLDRIIVLGDLDSRHIRRRAIRDPILQPASVFVDSYARIERCVATLTAALGGSQ